MDRSGTGENVECRTIRRIILALRSLRCLTCCRDYPMPCGLLGFCQFFSPYQLGWRLGRFFFRIPNFVDKRRWMDGHGSTATEKRVSGEGPLGGLLGVCPAGGAAWRCGATAGVEYISLSAADSRGAAS